MCKAPEPIEGQAPFPFNGETPEPGRPDILGGVWFKWDGRDRRSRSRSVSYRMTGAERDRYRGMLRMARSCGSVWKSFRKAEATPGGIEERRLVMMTACGLRVCEKCGNKNRERRCKRVLGPWGSFFTLTLPHREMGLRFAWERVHAWLRRFTIKLRRWVRGDAGQSFKGESFEYAWALEPHKSGYPHVHLVTSSRFIPWAVVKSLWNESTGYHASSMKAKRVDDVGGVSQYLAAYISKEVFPDELFALLFRKRLWACTLPAPKREPGVWVEEEETTPASAVASHDASSIWGDRKGWVREKELRGRFTIWRRLWQPDEIRLIGEVPNVVRAAAWGSRFKATLRAIQARHDREIRLSDDQSMGLSPPDWQPACPGCGADWHEDCRVQVSM